MPYEKMGNQSENALKLKALRERSGMTVRALAKAIGEKTSTYSYLEDKYKKQFLPVDRLKKIAPVLVGKGAPPITKEEIFDLSEASPVQNDGPPDQTKLRESIESVLTVMNEAGYTVEPEHIARMIMEYYNSPRTPETKKDAINMYLEMVTTPNKSR